MRLSLQDKQTEMKDRMAKARCNRQLSIRDEQHLRWLFNECKWSMDELAAYFNLSIAGAREYVKRRPYVKKTS